MQDFTEQFQVLLPKAVQPCREAIAALLEKLQVDGRNYQIGKTKVSTATLSTHMGPRLCRSSVPHQAWVLSTELWSLFWELENRGSLPPWLQFTSEDRDP